MFHHQDRNGVSVKSKKFKVVVLVAALLAVGSVTADPRAIRYYEDAVTRFDSGDFSGAMVQLKNAIKYDPTQLPFRILLANTHLELDQFEMAERELVKAAQLGADPALIALPLARARNALGKHIKVVELVRPDEYSPGSLGRTREGKARER